MRQYVGTAVPGKTAAWDDWAATVWSRIAAHEFEPPNKASLAARLAKATGWSSDRSREAIEEYRRFCFLAAVSPTPVTPSRIVDEVWHLHLTHTRDYWGPWCDALGKPLHHDPSDGGSDEDRRHAGQYAATLALYELHFGVPPVGFWPGNAPPADRRIAACLARAARRLLTAGFATLSGGGAALAQPAPSLHATAGGYVVADPGMTAVLFAATLVAAAVGYAESRTRAVSAAGPDLAKVPEPSAVDLAYLARGREHAARTVVMGLVEGLGGAPTETGVTFSKRRAPLPRWVEPFREHAVEGVDGRELVASVEREVRDPRPTLRETGALASAEAAERAGRRSLLGLVPALAVAALGMAAFPAAALGGSAALVLVLLAMVPCYALARSAAEGVGALVSRSRDAASRLVRAPLPGEVATAFALSGPMALAGTELADFQAMFRPAKRDGDDGGGGASWLSADCYGGSDGCGGGHGGDGGDSGGGHSCGGGHGCGGGGCGGGCGS